MTDFFAKTPFIAKKRKFHIPVHIVTEAGFSGWLKSQSTLIKDQVASAVFKGKPRTGLIIRDAKGKVTAVIAGINTPTQHYDLAAVADKMRREIPAAQLKESSFYLDVPKGVKADLEKAHIGWGWACYRFNAYKKPDDAEMPALVPASGMDRPRVDAIIRAVDTLRDMVNAPSNDCGPEELESHAKALAEKYKAKFKVITDQALIKNNFPLIYTVGKASPRRPRLIDLVWGDEKHPKVTLVGKGVCFDTGGLNIKPGASMRYMKKDMGGAAHVMALADIIMTLKLPVRLRVLVAAVENSINGEAFRPGDIMKSRKGLFVENTNTDAEGRLILADAITYACEESPELVIDFATLTGSARVALGPDIPAMFCNDDAIAADLQNISFEAEDPLWRMPLWQPYRKHNESSVADLHNSAGAPGDLPYSALFIESFLKAGKSGKVPAWVHIDTYAWEHTGRPGRPSGAADCGMRAVLALIEKRYGKKAKPKAAAAPKKKKAR